MKAEAEAPTGASFQAALHLPPGQNFSCHNTAVCCSAFPRVPVDEQSEAVLRGLDLERLPEAAERLCSIEDAIVGAERDARRLATVAHQACVFLCRDHLCEIHRVYGAESKPRACQEFPYRFRDTPGGAYVGLSFVCPSVRGNLGRSVAEQGDDLAGVYPRAYSRHDLAGELALNRHLTIGWEDYLAVEQAALEILALAKVPLKVRLISLSLLPGFIEQFHVRTHGEFAPMEPPRLLDSRELRELLGTLSQGGYLHILRVAAKSRRTSRLLRRMFMGTIAGFAGAVWAGNARPVAVMKVMGQYLRHASGLGRVRLEPLAKPVPYGRLERVEFPEEGDAAELLDRYARHVVFRKDLVHGHPVARGISMMLLNFSYIRWYAGAVACIGGKAAPDAADFSQAVAEVEKTFGFHSRFYELFATQPLVEQIVENFTGRRTYPFEIMG